MKIGTGPRREGVVVRDLFKAYGEVVAVNGVSLEVKAGEIVGLLGPNGAGKTTTVEAIVGLVRPDCGVISVCGIDTRARGREARARIGLVLQSTGLPDAITPKEAVQAFGTLYGVRPDVSALLAAHGLTEKADAKVASLSGGQRQRLALALAFVGDPDVIILDEPTVGLDPAARRDLQRQIAAMRMEGRAVLLATHDMDEATQLCDRVVVIDHGRVVADGAPADLIAAFSHQVRVEVVTDRPVSAEVLGDHPQVNDLTFADQTIRFATEDVAAVLPTLADLARSQGAAIVALSASRGTLEDVILHLARRP